ncbi:MAG TPA: hypothetical protein H9805_13955 [Candidatus Janibacter merdipullorum]|nr:hypothetical protein [Candidatus Janibacter merdipullorum]
MTGTSQPTPSRPAVGASSAPRTGAEATPTSVRLLLHSDNITTRDAVRAAVGRRPARDVEVESWLECATPAAVVEAVEGGDIDVVILDGEAAKTGGLGLCRQLKVEIHRCPPVLVLTGRPQDGWLATWSMADGSVPHPLDPIAVADAVADLARGVAR